MNSAQSCINVLKKNKNPITILIRVFLPAKSGITAAMDRCPLLKSDWSVNLFMRFVQMFERSTLTSTSVSDDVARSFFIHRPSKDSEKSGQRSKQDKGRDGKPAVRPPTDQ